MELPPRLALGLFRITSAVPRCLGIGSTVRRCGKPLSGPLCNGPFLIQGAIRVRKDFSPAFGLRRPCGPRFGISPRVAPLEMVPRPGVAPGLPAYETGA